MVDARQWWEFLNRELTKTCTLTFWHNKHPDICICLICNLSVSHYSWQICWYWRRTWNAQRWHDYDQLDWIKISVFLLHKHFPRYDASVATENVTWTKLSVWTAASFWCACVLQHRLKDGSLSWSHLALQVRSDMGRFPLHPACVEGNVLAWLLHSALRCWHWVDLEEVLQT